MSSSTFPPKDSRGRSIVLVSHCILNANSKVEGLSQYAGVHPLILRLADAGVGVVQLACPELHAAGMMRWGQTKEQYQYPAFEELCWNIADDAARQVSEYLRCGYKILGVIGIDGSPSCGVTKTCSGLWGGEYETETEMLEVMRSAQALKEPGILMECLQESLSEFKIPLVAIDESVPGHKVDDVMQKLGLE